MDNNKTIRISADNLVKRYKDGSEERAVIDHVSMSISKGEIIWLAGPSGSGKTTLLSLIGCILHPDEGRVMFDGSLVSKLSNRKLSDLRLHKIGFVFQDFNLVESLSVLDNVRIPMKLAKTLSRAEQKSRARELLERLGLGHKVKALPRELSGGEKQRVCIARAVANRPAMILADEPTANLDAENGHVVMELMAELAKECESSVLLASHDPRIESIVDRKLLMSDGRI